MGKFIWWEPTQSIEHNFEREEELTTAEAQVLADSKIAEELEAINSTLRDIFELLQTKSIAVDIVGS